MSAADRNAAETEIALNDIDAGPLAVEQGGADLYQVGSFGGPEQFVAADAVAGDGNGDGGGQRRAVDTDALGGQHFAAQCQPELQRA